MYTFSGYIWYKTNQDLDIHVRTFMVLAEISKGAVVKMYYKLG